MDRHSTDGFQTTAAASLRAQNATANFIQVGESFRSSFIRGSQESVMPNFKNVPLTSTRCRLIAFIGFREPEHSSLHEAKRGSQLLLWPEYNLPTPEEWEHVRVSLGSGQRSLLKTVRT